MAFYALFPERVQHALRSNGLRQYRARLMPRTFATDIPRPSRAPASGADQNAHARPEEWVDPERPASDKGVRRNPYKSLHGIL
jgi:hypothetical protein